MIKKLIVAVIFLTAVMNIRANGSSLFPEIPGWKMQEEKRVYNSGDLWELINGAADIFLSYYFQDLHIAEYIQKDLIIRVELYRHNSPANTYGIYTAERMPDYPQVTVGTQGYKSQGVLNFMAGNYYVKIMSAGVTEVDENTIALLAGKVDAKLAQPAGLPEETKLFPVEGKVFLSDNYIAQNFLGYSFFREAYSVRYGEQGEIQLFIIRLTPDEIQKMLDQYFGMVKADKVKQRDGYYAVDDMFNGMVFLLQKGNSLVGVLNTGNEEIALGLMHEVAGRLP
ncbi:MAG TPA: DUF6599 family protein [Bacteroidales bacterium]|nr:DUF6599 family protein [Bacteroidales bacterium]